MFFGDTFEIFILTVLVKKSSLNALFYKGFICGYVVVVKIVFGTEYGRGGKAKNKVGQFGAAFVLSTKAVPHKQ